MPHRQNSPVGAQPPSSKREYVLALIIAASIVVPTWIGIWWLLP